MNWSEQRVHELAAAKGLDPQKTTPKQDALLHIDITMNAETLMPTQERIGIDVKAPRKERRHDNHYMTTHTWLELRNVRGFAGSLLGQADYLALASPSGWIFIDRQKALNETLLKVLDSKSSAFYPSSSWRIKERGKSFIVLVPYEWLIKHSAEKLISRYYATNKQNTNASDLDASKRTAQAAQLQGETIQHSTLAKG